MDNSQTNKSEKRKIGETTIEDVRVKMETDHVPNTKSPGPQRKKLKKARKNVERTPLMLLNETFPSLEFILESAGGPSHQPEFLMSLVLEGDLFVNYLAFERYRFLGGV